MQPPLSLSHGTKVGYLFRRAVELAILVRSFARGKYEAYAFTLKLLRDLLKKLKGSSCRPSLTVRALDTLGVSHNTTTTVVAAQTTV